MQNAEATTNEIMEFLEKNMVTRVEFVDFKEEVYDFRDEFYDFKAVTKIDFMVLKDEVKLLSDRVGNIETRVGHIENQMVTKDYLDDKSANLGAEIRNRINQQIKRHEI